MPATLQSKFPYVIAELRPRVSAATKQGAEAIAAEARNRVPVSDDAKTVHLRDAIHVERVGVAEYGVFAGGGPEDPDTDIYYGHMVEHGTARGQPPQPFLVPAAEMLQAEVVASVNIVLRGLG